MKRACVCISHTGSDTGGGSNKGVSGGGRMSTSSIIKSYAVA